MNLPVSRENQSLCRRDIRIWDSAYNSMPDHSILWPRVGSTQNLVESRTVPASAANLILESTVMNRGFRLNKRLAKSECGIPNAERNPKSEAEARSQRRSVSTLGSPGNTEEGREGMPPAARDGWKATLRNSDFMTPKLWISVMRIAARVGLFLTPQDFVCYQP